MRSCTPCKPSAEADDRLVVSSHLSIPYGHTVWTPLSAVQRSPTEARTSPRFHLRSLPSQCPPTFRIRSLGVQSCSVCGLTRSPASPDPVLPGSVYAGHCFSLRQLRSVTPFDRRRVPLHCTSQASCTRPRKRSHAHVRTAIAITVRGRSHRIGGSPHSSRPKPALAGAALLPDDRSHPSPVGSASRQPKSSFFE